MFQQNMFQPNSFQQNMHPNNMHQHNMPFQRINDKQDLKYYEDKMIMVQSEPGFTHLFRLTECKKDSIIGIMFTGMDFEPVKIPLDNINCFYVAQSDYERINAH